jgi:hypothetical protein
VITKFLVTPASTLEADKADRSVATGIKKLLFFKAYLLE